MSSDRASQLLEDRTAEIQRLRELLEECAKEFQHAAIVVEYWNRPENQNVRTEQRIYISENDQRRADLFHKIQRQLQDK